MLLAVRDPASSSEILIHQIENRESRIGNQVHDFMFIDFCNFSKIDKCY
jgi:hypothetical protein